VVDTLERNQMEKIKEALEKARQQRAEAVKDTQGIEPEQMAANRSANTHQPSKKNSWKAAGSSMLGWARLCSLLGTKTHMVVTCYPVLLYLNLRMTHKSFLLMNTTPAAR